MKHPLIRSVSLVMLASLVSVSALAQTESAPPASPSAPATAPVPSATPTSKAEVIQVTGSRIKRKDLDVASPLTIYGREDIENTGAETVTDVVKSLPSAVGNSVTTTTTNGGGGGSGNIALRGLDSTSTLILVNGRRLPVDANGSSPDLNSIPVGAIERIEVLQDGASAIYGSDAIAGVVNIITRKNYEGLDANVYFGRSHKGDMETKNYDLAYGVANDKGSMVLGLNYYKQEGVKSRDRQVSREAINKSSSTPTGTIRGLPGGVQVIDPVTNLPAPSTVERYNYSQVTSAIMNQDRKSLFFNGDYQLTDTVKGFVETSFTNVESSYTSAAVPIFTANETGDITVAADNQFNAFGVPISDVRRRLVELGPREQASSSDTLRFVAGLQGEVKTWTWDLAANRGDVDVISQNKNIISKTNLMLGIGGPTACGPLTTVGCVPVNILGGPGSITAAQLDWLRLNATDYAKTSLTSYTFNTAGELLETPFGLISMAAGAEVREETYDNQTDSNSQKFNTIGNTNQRATKGDRQVKEVYLEFQVPVTKVVEIDLAARYSDYDDFGDTTNPKVGLKITPLDGLTVRGTYATGFRAPDLTELNQGDAESFQALNDPCTEAGACASGDADPSINQYLTISGGNKDLEAEKSKSYTFGLAYSYQNAINAKADYWVIDTENAIDTNPQFIIDQFRANGTFADRVTVDAQNNITQINAVALNLAARRIKGLDLGVDYALQNTASGTYTFNLLATHFINYQNQADATSDFTNVVGKYSDAAGGGRGSIPKWKGLFDVGYAIADVSAGVTMNYVSRLDDGVGDGAAKLDAWRTYDARVAYSFNDYGKLTLGIDNVTDKAPPTSAAAFNDNIDARTHNLIGRFYYARYGFKI